MHANVLIMWVKDLIFNATIFKILHQTNQITEVLCSKNGFVTKIVLHILACPLIYSICWLTVSKVDAASFDAASFDAASWSACCKQKSKELSGRQNVWREFGSNAFLMQWKKKKKKKIFKKCQRDKKFWCVIDCPLAYTGSFIQHDLSYVIRLLFFTLYFYYHIVPKIH